jgi:hypothetical protein
MFWWVRVRTQEAGSGEITAGQWLPPLARCTGLATTRLKARPAARRAHRLVLRDAPALHARWSRRILQKNTPVNGEAQR